MKTVWVYFVIKGRVTCGQQQQQQKQQSNDNISKLLHIMRSYLISFS